MRSSYLLAIFILLVGCPLALVSQSDTTTISQDQLQKLAVYRDHLLTKDTAALEDLRLLLSRWNALGANEHEQIDFTFNVLIARVVQAWSYKLIKKKAKEHSPGIIAETFTEADLQVIARNADVLDLLLLGVLKWEYPFMLDTEADLLQEIATYDLVEGERLGDIGAGQGVLCVLLKILHPGAEIYINELDRDFIAYINAKLERSDEEALTFGIKTVKGGRRTTELEGADLDVIIVRNTLHHFKYPQEMLASIQASLRPGGRLLVYESVPELDQDGDLCSAAISRTEILQLLSNSGFQLAAEWEISEGVLLQLTYNER